jgi:hypothetical protein
MTPVEGIISSSGGLLPTQTDMRLLWCSGVVNMFGGCSAATASVDDSRSSTDDHRGMDGVIFRRRDVRGRDVAVMIVAVVTTERAWRRFAHEAQILARFIGTAESMTPQQAFGGLVVRAWLRAVRVSTGVPAFRGDT